MGDAQIISLKTVASLILAFTALLVWKETYQYHCISLVIPAFVILIISLNARRWAIQRRSCFAKCYFCKSSIITRIYHGKVVVTILAFLASIISGAVLMLNIITWNLSAIVLLAADLVILLLLYWAIQKLLNKSLNKLSAPIFIKNVTSALNTVILLVSLTVIQFYSKMPNYLASGWKETITRASNQTNSYCPITNNLVKAQSVKEATGWWLILSTTAQSSNVSIKYIGWLIFLLSGSISLWAYSRYMTEVIYMSIRGQE